MTSNLALQWGQDNRESTDVLAEFRVDLSLHQEDIFKEIAIGQSIGAWQEAFVPAAVLQKKVARVLNLCADGPHHMVGAVVFPWDIWHGRINDLLTLLYGKMSFYRGVQLHDLHFGGGCFVEGLPDTGRALVGPRYGIQKIKHLVGGKDDQPLLMGILKPNVGMDAQRIASLYALCARAGLHVLKDDEIRNDPSVEETVLRVKAVAEVAKSEEFPTIYAVHFQCRPDTWLSDLRRLEDAGAQCLLVNVWTAGMGWLQMLRRATNLPLMAHPALVGALGVDANGSALHPRVTMGAFLRAAGADFSLFPSPYGKIGLSHEIVKNIFETCTRPIFSREKIGDVIPVPSAGVKASHAPLAQQDFGNDFVLNAGTGIFAAADLSPAAAIGAFLGAWQDVSAAQEGR